MTSKDDRWLSLNEICNFLGVSNDTVYKWIHKGGLPAYRVGRLWKFKRKDVDEWVKAGGTNKQIRTIINRNEAIGKIQESMQGD